MAAEHRDIVYKTTAARPLALDIYVPDGVRAPPLVIWVHGGAWRTGSRAKPPALYLLDRGFAVASISYRFSQEAVFPAQIEDCRDAVRWLRGHASQYGYDATRIGVWGASAGGHLAALLGTSGSGVDKVHAVVDFFGPTDIPEMAKFPGKMDHNSPDSPESQLIGGPLQENKEKAALANPIRFVTADDPPFLIVHGDQDPLVPPNQSELLETALKSAGVPVEYLVLKGAGHGGPQFSTPEIRDKITAFFHRHLRAK
jgi:acetyl esterase/lipase